MCLVNSSLRWTEGTTKTNRLRCMECGQKISKGGKVVFGLDEVGRVEEVYHIMCAPCDYDYHMDMHPFSAEALGQD